LGDETVFVLYAAEPTCKADDATTSWRVPRGTVLEITVRFSKSTHLADLGFDISKFEKTSDREFPGIAYYNDSNNGVLIEAAGLTIRSITYYGSAKDEHLSCKSAKDVKKVKP
jgi:hypothetical protein